MELAILVSTNDPAELRSQLRQASELGFAAAQLWARYPAADEEWRSIADELSALGLRLIAIGGYAHPLQPDAEARRASIAELRAAIERAPSLGCATVVTWSGTRNESLFADHPENRSPATWDEEIDHFREVAGWAEAAGVTVAIEPFHNHVASTPERLRDLIAATGSTRIGAVMDPPNFLKADQIEQVNTLMPAMFETLLGRIALVHAKDIRRPEPGETRSVLAGVVLPHPGAGIMDYGLYARLIREHYDGPVVVEHFTSETMAAARDHVARHLEETRG